MLAEGGFHSKQQSLLNCRKFEAGKCSLLTKFSIVLYSQRS